MIKKCSRCLAVSLSRAKIIGLKKNEKEREKTHLETTPQRHTQSTENREHGEVTNAESRMETASEAGQKCAKECEGGRGLYNCCKELWLGGQRNNQLKALMASDGVAVQGRWNQRLGLQLEWEVTLTVGLGLELAVRCGGMWCASAANNGAMASVISCNCFPSFMTISSSSFASCSSVSLCESFSTFHSVAFPLAKRSVQISSLQNVPSSFSCCPRLRSSVSHE